MAHIFGSIWDRFNRNALNALSKSVEVQGKTIQDLVADGQLTPAQYSQLLREVNGLIAKGEVKPDDLSPELLELINNSDGTPFEILSIPRNRSVSPEKTTFIESSSNLAEIKNVMYNADIDGTTGEPIAVSGVSTLLNHFIPVEAGEEYTFNKVGKAYVYDSGGNLIQDLGIYSTSNPVTRRIGANGAFCKLIVATDLIDIQMNKGDTLLPYEPFYNDLSDSVSIYTKNLKGELDASKFEDNSISVDKVDFIETSTNLLNMENIEEGKMITATSDGQLEDSNSWHVSELIKLPAGDAITFHPGSNDCRVAFYDVNSEFLSTSYSSNAPATISIPDDAVYARFNIYQDDTFTPQINMGNELLPYEPYYIRLIGFSNESGSNESGSNESGNIAIKNIDGYTIAGTLEGFYNQSALPARGGGMPSQQANINFDAYVDSHPHYVTKTHLTDSVEGQPIYLYDFNPNIVGDDDPVTKFPTIFITCGAHGSERMPPLVANHFMNQLVNDWESNELLETLRWNVRFLIIPMLNPDGWGLGTRQNANGIDLIRQFPTGWRSGTPGSNTYGGTAPLTEPEAIAAHEVFEEHKNEMIYMCDFHNFSRSSDPFWFIWNVGGTAYNNNLGKSHISELSRKWKRKYEWFPQDETHVIGRSNWVPNGTITAHAAENGVQSSIYEVSLGLVGDPTEEDYSSNVMTIATEAFINWIILNVKNNIPLENFKRR